MGYTYKEYNREHMARVLGRDLPISTKQSIEICNFIRNKTTKKAKDQLTRVVNKKTAVPYKVHVKDIPHRKGKIATGRFPMNASKQIIELIESVEANAQNKNLDTNNLIIKHISAHKASTPWHYGRKRRRKMKRTHIEIVVEEKQIKETPKKQKEGKK